MKIIQLDKIKITAVSILVVLFTLFFLTGLGAQQPPATSADSADPNFDFSVYFTGNVRGNLEPCG